MLTNNTHRYDQANYNGNADSHGARNVLVLGRELARTESSWYIWRKSSQSAPFRCQ